MAHANGPSDERELERVLTENYNYLVRHISPREFIPHLISKNVISAEDKEDIEHKITSVDRAGRLIDIVKMRGFRGMHELMLILEYEVPAAFFRITNREARSPPKDWVDLRRPLPSMRIRRSRDSIVLMKNLIAHLITEIDQQKKSVGDLMGCMQQVKHLQDDSLQEHEESLKDTDNEISELESRCATLARELVASEKQKTELSEKYDKLRQENESYLKVHDEDRARLTALQDRYDALNQELEHRVSRKSRFQGQNVVDVHALQEEVERLSDLLQSSVQKQEQETVARQKRYISELSQRNVEFNADMMTAQEQRDKLAAALKEVETRLAEKETQLKECGTHKMQYMHEYLAAALKEVEARLAKKETELTAVREECATHKMRADDLSVHLDRLDSERYWQERKMERSERRKGTPTPPVTPTYGADPFKPFESLLPVNKPKKK